LYAMKIHAYASMLLLFSALCAGREVSAQGLVYGGDGDSEPRKIRMREPGFSFQDPRLVNEDKDPALRASGVRQERMLEKTSYESDPVNPAYRPRVPVEKLQQGRKKKNWILPPKPDNLEDDPSMSGADDAPEGDDLESRVRALYERAYMTTDEDDPEREPQGAEDDEGGYGPDQSYRLENPMGLLLPESGMALSPVVGLLGEEETAESTAFSGSAIGTLETGAGNPYGPSAESMLGFDPQGGDLDMEPETLMLTGVGGGLGEEPLAEEIEAMAITRSLLPGTRPDGQEGTDGGAASSFAATQTRFGGVGNWRSVLSSRASAMRFGAGDSEVGSEPVSRPGGLTGGRDFGLGSGSTFNVTAETDLPGRLGSSSGISPGGSLFTSPAGSSPGLFSSGGKASLGNRSIGGFGMSGSRSLGGIPTPSTSVNTRPNAISSLGSSTLFGSGARTGVRATEDIPNPLGGSLFE
jgi:hypothetical protein